MNRQKKISMKMVYPVFQSKLFFYKMSLYFSENLGKSTKLLLHGCWCFKLFRVILQGTRIGWKIIDLIPKNPNIQVHTERPYFYSVIICWDHPVFYKQTLFTKKDVCCLCLKNWEVFCMLILSKLFLELKWGNPYCNMIFRDDFVIFN